MKSVEPARTLGWAGDSEMSVLPELDRVFDLRLPRDMSHVETVGDLWAYVEARHLAEGDREGGCHTAMAFYRLRRAAYRDGEARPAIDSELRPPAGMNWRGHLNDLERRTGLVLPRPGWFWPHYALLAGMLVALTSAWTGWMAPRQVWLAAFAALLGLITIPLRLRRRRRTFRAISREAVELSPAPLMDAGGRIRQVDLWRRFVEILTIEGSAKPVQVALTTRFYPQREPRRRWFG